VAKGRITDWGHAIRASPLPLQPQPNAYVTMTVPAEIAIHKSQLKNLVASAMDSRNRMGFRKVADGAFLVR
jgi:hypothetical protein